MCKYFSFGKTDSYFKYVYLYIIFKLINKYSFKGIILKKIEKNNDPLLNDHKIINRLLIYFFIFFF